MSRAGRNLSARDGGASERRSRGRTRVIGSFSLSLSLAGELMVSRRVAPISRRYGGAYARNVQT